MNGLDGRHLIVSIDCLPEALTEDRETVSTAELLVQLFGRYRVPATWAFADPANAPLVQGIRSQDCPHRIALLAEPHWAGRQVERTAFAREFVRRVESAAIRQTPVQSLALRDVALNRHFDLLVRHRMAVVRASGVGDPRNSPPYEVCSPRFGIFRFVANASYPQPRGWFGLRAKSPQQMLHSNGWVHLLLDVPSWRSAGRADWRRLRRFLEIAERKSRGQNLRCITAETMVRQLAAVPSRSPVAGSSRSRRAA